MWRSFLIEEEQNFVEDRVVDGPAESAKRFKPQLTALALIEEVWTAVSTN